MTSTLDRPLTEEDLRAYRNADSDSVPVLSVDDFVPSGSTMHLPLAKLVTRFVFFVFLILIAGEPDEMPQPEFASKVVGWYRLLREIPKTG
jgi:hypothetical protein